MYPNYIYILNNFILKSKPRFEKYAKIHNLKHIIYTELDADFKRSALWFKIYKILEQLALGNSVILLDADISILNFDVLDEYTIIYAAFAGIGFNEEMAKLIPILFFLV